MKGFIFTEFLELVEQRYTAALVDEIIDLAALPSKGAYTAVGTYPYQEMIALAGALSDATGTPVRILMKRFGEHLFGRFEARYPHLFEESHSAFHFLSHVQRYIHSEVKKLYPDARPPSLAVEAQGASGLSLTYSSARPLGDLCEGLIRGCLSYFGDESEVIRTDLESGSRTKIRFDIVRGTG